MSDEKDECTGTRDCPKHRADAVYFGARAGRWSTPEPADQTRADAVSTDPDGDRARHDAWLAGQTRADVVLSEAEREVIDAVRREVGPRGGYCGTGDGNWQPMIAAVEVWTLLDITDRLAARVRAALDGER